MPRHPHEDLLQRGYAALAEGDLTTLDALLADEVIVHIAGSGPLAGDWFGKEAFFALVEMASQLNDALFHVVHDVLVNDDHAVGLVRMQARRGGRVLDLPVVHVLHVEDGKVREVWFHPYDQDVADAFWIPEPAREPARKAAQPPHGAGAERVPVRGHGPAGGTVSGV